MSYKDYKKKHREINTSVPSKWPFRLGVILLVALTVFLVGYDMPPVWNSTIGQIPGLHLSAPDFQLGLDLVGGTHLVYEADLSEIPELEKNDALGGVRDVIERRVNAFGVAEPVVQTTKSGGQHRVIVELAGVSDVNEAITQIGETPILEFKIPNPDAPENDSILSAQGVTLETADGETILVGEDGVIDTDTETIASEDETSEEEGEDSSESLEPWLSTDLNGSRLKRARVEFNQANVPYVTLVFDGEGGKLFGEITEAHVNQRIAIFLDGEMISAPVVQQAIVGGEAVITGVGDLEEAKLLAQRLNAGALPVPINLISQQTVGPTLGAISLEKSMDAALIGLALVALFMILYYRLPGVLSVVALAVYAVFVLAIFKFLPVTLTLAGLAGFILSVGMAVDANVLIFERMKEELNAGHSLKKSIDEGFKRAWTSIRDGNVTTLIACAILYWLSSSFIQGFALTLAIGVIASMFSAIVVTRLLLRLVAAIKPLNRAGLYSVKELR